MHYELNKVKESLPEVLSDRTPGPKPQKKLAEEAGEASPSEEGPDACPECGGKVTKIERLTQRVGRRAEATLARLSECRQAVARFLLYDETYPKMQRRVYSLGVAICEHGLIRSVHCIVQKAKDIPTCT